MATIKPLKGIRYNLDKIEDINKVTAPPYDVINPVKQDYLYNLHENNIVRLILGKQHDSDTDSDNRYTRSKKCFEEWVEKEIVKTDEEPSIYIYKQEYSFAGKHNTRTGFLARYKLSNFSSDGEIKPHENTLAKPKEDRLKLTKACKANFSPIFGLYSDPEDIAVKSFNSALNQNPIIDFKDDAGVRHSFWRVTDKDIIDTVVKSMDSKKILIADGHHRYETAVNYMEEMKNVEFEGRDDNPTEYVLMYFTNIDSEGLSVFPIHRIVSNLTDFNSNEFIERCSEYFNVERINKNGTENRKLFFNKIEEDGKNGHVIGLYTGDNEYIILTLKSIDLMEKFLSPETSKGLRELDVSVLHTLLIENILKISKSDLKNQTNVTYKVNDQEAENSVDEGKSQIAFFLNPTRIDEIQKVVSTGEKMPQKSTFFYPKLITGLVINSLE